MASLRVSWIVVLALLLGACSDERQELLVEYRDVMPVKRAGAVRSLAKAGDDEAYTLVSRALEDRSAIVRIAAVWSLHEFKGRDALAAILRASQDPDPEVREAVVVVLGKREGQPATQAMIQMLLRGETNGKVRRLLVDNLAARGLSGEKLTGEMAESQLGLLQTRLAEDSAQDRVQVLVQAGRSVHPGAIDLLLEGMEQEDGEVVQAAVAALDGRGGAEALRRLQLLMADPMSGIRAAAVRALAGYGQGGLTLLVGALRDPDADVRLAALEALAGQPTPPAADVLCPLLLDEDPRVALLAARSLAPRAARCDPAGLGSALAAASDGPDFRRLVGVLGVLGGEVAVALLAREQTRRKPASPAFLLAARVRAGDRSPALLKECEQAFERGVTDAERLLVSWPSERLGPGVQLGLPLPPPPSGGEPAPPEDEDEDEDEGAAPHSVDGSAGKVALRPSQLSDDELKALYAKHKLGDVRADSPRAIGDILAAFPEKGQPPKDARLFPPVAESDLTDLALLVEALTQLAPARAGAAAERVLALGQRGATSGLARVLLGAAEAFQPSEAGLRALARTLAEASAAEAEPIAGLLARSGQPAAARALADALEPAAWDKREVLLEALGRMKRADTVPALAGMLKGYSAIAAARALAEVHDPAGVAPLRAALGQAGPVEEMEILMALARLGDHGELPRILEKLDSPDPDMRRAAVRVLGVIGVPEAREALKGLRYDLDRLVRLEVNRIIEGIAPPEGGGERTPGEGRDGQHP